MIPAALAFFPFLDRGRVHIQEIHQPDGEDRKILQISLSATAGLRIETTPK
jgi:hypothetical protein